MSPLSEKSPKAKVHIPQQSSSFRPSPIIIWSLALLISATGLFFSRKWIAAVFSPYFAHAPAATVHFEHPTQPEVSSAAGASVPSVSPSAQPSVPPSSAPADTPVSSREPSTSPQTPVSREPSAALSTSAQSLRLDVAVTDKCWISIDRDGSPAFRKLLEPGEAQTLSAAERFFIIVGNAGAVHLKINGKPVKPIGRPGEVIKLLIDEKNLPDLIDPTAG